MTQLQECPVCRGNGYLGIVPSRWRRHRPTSRPRPATTRRDPAITRWFAETFLRTAGEHIDWTTPHMVDTVTRVFRQACDPKGPIGPLSEEEWRSVVQRLYGYVDDAERQGLPQSQWRKLNLCASEIIMWYKGGAP